MFFKKGHKNLMFAFNNLEKVSFYRQYQKKLTDYNSKYTAILKDVFDKEYPKYIGHFFWNFFIRNSSKK